MAKRRKRRGPPRGFEGWVDRVFTGQASHDDDPPHVDDRLEVARITWLFEHCAATLEHWSDADAAEGLRWLISEGGSEALIPLGSGQIPQNERDACIRSMLGVYTGVFARRCAPVLSHLDEPGGNPLNQTCYMWWDVIALGWPVPADLNRVAVAVMMEALGVEHVAVQESALHGLGHFGTGPMRLEMRQAIGEFLRRRRVRPLRPELVAYAEAAREGMVQ